MATKLLNSVVRESFATIRGRKIIVEIKPPETIVLRLKGLHSKMSVSLLTVFDLALKIEANNLLMQKQKARQEKKMNKGGL